MTRVFVLDTETTGVDHEVDRIVEVAGVLLDDGVVVDTFQSLVDPGRDVPPGASAVHHLTAKDLVGAPSLAEALAAANLNRAEYLVAHNAAFDQGFLKVDGPWICTWKCALRVYPDAPSYSNQVLRYWLGLPDPVSGGSAHRALYDAECTANLFVKMLERATSDDPYERMVEITRRPALLVRVAFGVHRDKLWSQLPKDYLNWILKKSSGWDDNVIYTAKHWLERAA